jgi:hypothetical protein
MNTAEILIWESANALLLIPVVMGLVMLVRWIRRRPVFTERVWLLFGDGFSLSAWKHRGNRAG